MPFLTALREHTIKRLEEIGQADLLIGIPSYNNDQTIRHVMKTASHGAAEFFPGLKVLIFVSDGGSRGRVSSARGRPAARRRRGRAGVGWVWVSS